MKKLLCVFIPALLLLSTVSFSAFANYGEEADDGIPPESASGSFYNYDWSYDSETKTITFSDNGSPKLEPPVEIPDFSGYGEYESMEKTYEWNPEYPWFENPKYAVYAEKAVFDSSVKEIMNYHLRKFYNLTSLEMAPSVKTIGSDAFQYCRKLKDIEYNGTLEETWCNIFYGTAFQNDKSNWDGNYLYFGNALIIFDRGGTGTSSPFSVKDGTVTVADAACEFLGYDSLVLPDSVRFIGERAFLCSKFRNITLSSNLERIGEEAFCCCRYLEEITLPESLKHIENGAFSECVGLSVLKLPAGVEAIGTDESIVKSCYNIKAVEVDGNNKNFCSVNGVVFSRDKTEIVVYPEAKEDEYYEIPSGVKTVYPDFCNVKSLRGVSITNKVPRIANELSPIKRYFYMGT
ncbi:MAG: leucine-rich repeat domain-containing protein [Eubacterium sp.]|nr:leucine-rich repeat domain-containing protein [Eubacterium sp.]